MQLYKIIQRVTREYGRFSALPHHPAERIQTYTSTTIGDTKRPMVGSVFEYTPDEGRVFVTYHEPDSIEVIEADFQEPFESIGIPDGDVLLPTEGNVDAA